MADLVPIGASQIEVEMPLPRVRQLAEQGHEQILIVDDDEAVADSLKSLLEGFGYDVRSYNSGANFLADNRRRTAGCLILDQHMPGLSGLDVVACLQKEGARAAIILISGRLDTKIKQRAASLGVTTVLEKPFFADHLVNLIRKALMERN
jgi:FixJ family two-component response regulator